VEAVATKLVVRRPVCRRAMGLRLVAACLLLPLAALVAVVATSGPAPQSGATANRVIPPDYLAAYITSAATCPGLRPTLLEAVGSVESGHGANMGPSSAGALGPMQFMPATFAEYAPGQPREAIMDPAVAIPAAARMLCSDGIGTNPATALAGYGASVTAQAAGAAYAAKVLTEEQRIIASGPALIGAPGVSLSADALLDAASSGLDPRLVSLLVSLGASVPITIGTLRTGHTADVTGPNGEDTGRLSNHTAGRAADLTSIGGQQVSKSNLAAHALVANLAAMAPPDRPSEVGSPFPDIAPSARWFTVGHDTHVHIGYDA
jgi:hypothetical protein